MIPSQSVSSHHCTCAVLLDSFTPPIGRPIISNLNAKFLQHSKPVLSHSQQRIDINFYVVLKEYWRKMFVLFLLLYWIAIDPVITLWSLHSSRQKEIINSVTFYCDKFKTRAKSSMASDMKKVTHHINEIYCGGLMILDTTDVYTHIMVVLPKTEYIQHSTGPPAFPREANTWKGQVGSFRRHSHSMAFNNHTPPPKLSLFKSGAALCLTRVLNG